MNKKIALATLISFLSLTSLLAADFWDQKPYNEWTQKECERILADSPWAYPYAITGVSIPGMMNFETSRQTPSRSFGDSNAGGSTGDREVHLIMQIRFLTAKPLKAAIGQMRLIADPENTVLESQVKQYVDQENGPEVAVEITFRSEPEGHPAIRQIEGFFRTATLPSLQNKVWLSEGSRDVHVPILRYQGPYEGYSGALLFFSRFDESGKDYFENPEDDILFHLEADFGMVDLLTKTKNMRFNDEFTM